MLEKARLKALKELCVDDKFSAQAEALGLFTIQDVMTIGIAELKAKPGFTMMWYADLLQILKNLGLLDEFQNKLFKE